MKLSDEDAARISEAVAVAERRTSGEIRCVLAAESSDPRLSAAFWAAAWALAAPAAAVALGLRPDMLARLFGGWTVGHLSAQAADVASALTLYAVVQSLIFALVLALAALAPVRRALSLPGRLAAQVHEAALDQFEALGLARTRDRTGVLLYVSLAEHRAEVLADLGIYEAAPHAVWDEVAALLIAGVRAGRPADGFVDAVNRTGEILAAHLPPRTDDANELPDAVVERPRRR